MWRHHRYLSTSLSVVGLVLAFLTISEANSDTQSHQAQNVTIVVLGLTGVGKSDVITQLFNWKSSKVVENDWESKLQEFHVKFGTDDIDYLRVVDVSGFVMDKKPDEDAETLTVLSNYLKEELHARKPSIVLITSTYDDNRAAGPSSNFVQMLKRVRLLKDELLTHYESLSLTNCIFLFTQLGRVRSATKWAIERKLDTFKDIIRNYTEFADPIVTIVGENNAEGYGLQRDADGFTKLSNDELYPKNLLDKMAELTSELGDKPAGAAVQLLLQNYGADSVDSSTNAQAHGEPILREITYASLNRMNPESGQQKIRFLQQITGSVFQISSSEVATAFQKVWDTQIDSSSKRMNPTALAMLQKTLQGLNITQRSQLPSTTPEIVKLYRRLPNQEIFGQLLQTTFGITQPQLFVPLIAGYGYDLVTDTVLESTPWDFGSRRSPVPTELGYKLPPEYVVTTLNQTQDVIHYIQDMQDYITTRLKDLRLAAREQVDNVNFRGQVRLAYNMKPLPADEQYFSLSAIKEFRNFRLDINEEMLSLNSEFTVALSRLTPFDQNIQESEKEWKSFFSKYGTHIILSAFGGGCMQATINLGNNVQQLQTSTSTRLQNLKNTLLEFSTFPDFMQSSGMTIMYNFFGGSPKSRMQGMYNLDDNQRQVFMSEWLESVQLAPVMTQTSLTLKPISQLVSMWNSTLGAIVEQAAQLYYANKLKYFEYQTPRVANRTRRPTITTTRDNSIAATPSSLPPAVTTTSSSYVTPDPTTTTTAQPIYSRNPHQPSQNENQMPRVPTSTSASTLTSTCTKTDESATFVPDVELLVGFGYNLFHDLGVRKSPFVLGKRIAPYEFPQYEKVNVTKYTSNELYNASCVIVNSKHNYILRRIHDLESTHPSSKTWSTHEATIQPLKESSFHYTTVKPGYTIITNPQKPNRVSAIEENRLYKMYVDDWRRLSLSLSFKSDFEKLPFNRNDCAAKLAWVAFFQKYGTHVLISRNVGYAVEVAKYIKVSNPTDTISNVNLCASFDHSTRMAIKATNSLYNNIAYLWDSEYKREKMEMNFLNLDMKFEELSTIIMQFYNFEKGFAINSAISDIWKSGSEC